MITELLDVHIRVNKIIYLIQSNPDQTDQNVLDYVIEEIKDLAFWVFEEDNLRVNFAIKIFEDPLVKEVLFKQSKNKEVIDFVTSVFRIFSSCSKPNEALEFFRSYCYLINVKDQELISLLYKELLEVKKKKSKFRFLDLLTFISDDDFKNRFLEEI